ncbi:hypothetical protein [Nocardia sp. NPDC050710]|uniref:hypothetical protein n=1 Tax=Nocardia sp. NPDC050710 TaxID=3157220 RepID=UPI0033DFD526
MGTDDQLSMDLGVEVEQTAWGKWVDPDRRAAQVRKFLDYAGLQGIPSKPWPEGSPDVKRLDPVIAKLFPDMDTAMASENEDMADAFICFVGECFVRFVGAEWFDYEWLGRENSFYDDVNPAVRCDTYDGDEMTMWSLMEDIITYDPDGYIGMFSYLAAALRDYAADHEEKRREETEFSN